MRPIFNAVWRRRALSGDADAVRTLADEVLTPLYHFCLYRVGRDGHLCEEVVQETLVRALRDLSNYDPKRCGDNIFPWLTGLARNEISRALTHAKQTVSLDLLWARVDKELAAVFERIEAEPFDDEVLRREETRDLVNVTMSQPAVSLPRSTGSEVRQRAKRPRSGRYVAPERKVRRIAADPCPQGISRHVRRPQPDPGNTTVVTFSAACGDFSNKDLP